MPFKRVAIAMGLAWLACCGVAAAAVPPRAELRGLACRHAGDASGRSVSVTAVMRPVPGTVRMALKFTLERRTGAAFHSVPGRQLGQWLYPANATLGENPADVWILKENVVNLVAPASYRFRAWFRWTGSGGRVLVEAMRVSANCHEPAVQPNLVVKSIAMTSLGNGSDRYSALIRNAGGVDSGAFSVRLDPPGAPAQSLVSRSLRPGATERESFDAPACAPGSQVTVVADPQEQVSDSNRADNSLTVACSTTSGHSYTS